MISRILKLKIPILIFMVFILSLACQVHAQDDLEAMRDTYFRENKYSEFVEYLKSFPKKDAQLSYQISYYIALSRYQQLKHLEKIQNWDEYFNLGNSYREELTNEIAKVIDSTDAMDSLHIYARCLLWRFHKDQNDGFEDKARRDLINAVIEYAKNNVDTQPVKYVADIFSEYKNLSEARRIYSIYAKRLIEATTDSGKLKQAAQDAYQKGNLSLARLIYDAYIEQITKSFPEDKLISELISLAEDFAYKDEGFYDVEYASRLFSKLEEITSSAVFDEQLSYSRAYNSEKAKEFSQAIDQYSFLAENFPQSQYYDETLLKIGLLYAYALKDTDKARSYFEKLSDSQKISPQVISAIYQLGLISQWQEDFTQAEKYYQKLLEKAEGSFLDIQSLAKERLTEIKDKSGRIEYNLKTFLDISLSSIKQFPLNLRQIELSVKPFKVKKGQTTKVTSSTYLPSTGCLAVEITYLWSGDLGESIPGTGQVEFSTSYSFSGTKIINLVVATPTGIIGSGFIMLEVE